MVLSLGFRNSLQSYAGSQSGEYGPEGLYFYMQNTSGVKFRFHSQFPEQVFLLTNDYLRICRRVCFYFRKYICV